MPAQPAENLQIWRPQDGAQHRGDYRHISWQEQQATDLPPTRSAVPHRHVVFERSKIIYFFPRGGWSPSLQFFYNNITLQTCCLNEYIDKKGHV